MSFDRLQRSRSAPPPRPVITALFLAILQLCGVHFTSGCGDDEPRLHPILVRAENATDLPFEQLQIEQVVFRPLQPGELTAFREVEALWEEARGRVVINGSELELSCSDCIAAPHQTAGYYRVIISRGNQEHMAPVGNIVVVDSPF